MKHLCVTLALLFSFYSGCATREKAVLIQPTDPDWASKETNGIKVHMKDGTLYFLSAWSAADGKIEGTGDLYDQDRSQQKEGNFVIAIADVAIIESTRRVLNPAIAPIALMVGTSAVTTTVCLIDPKACFGSCPTFYTEETGERIMAEGFSSSVAPALEDKDLDALYLLSPKDKTLSIRMTNEAYETHVVRYVKVFAAKRPDGGRVLATNDGVLYQATDLTAPSTCKGAEEDCLKNVLSFDDTERFSAAGDKDLAEKEYIELTFPKGAAQRGLIVSARHTLLTTFLLYQWLAYMGRSAGDWLAALERHPEWVEKARSMSDLLGGIAVDVQDARGKWVTAGVIRETGPLATDTKIVPLPANTGEKIRLRVTKGHWRINMLSLATLGEQVTPEELPSEQMVPLRSSVAISDGTITAMPGDQYRFDFTLPEEAKTYDYFLETRGYYLEWMRREWLVDEDQKKAIKMFRKPEAMLKELAPKFKKNESKMEEIFWSSRYESK